MLWEHELTGKCLHNFFELHQLGYKQNFTRELEGSTDNVVSISELACEKTRELHVLRLSTMVIAFLS